MNKKIYKVFILASIVLLSSCKGFLDKGPLTQPYAKGFLSDRQRVEDYVNGLYTALPSYGNFGIGRLGEDINSDNMVSQNYDKRLDGELNINDSQSSWFAYYSRVRSVNYLLAYFSVPKNAQTKEIMSLLGEAYFLRAWWTFALLRDFGRVPIPNTLWDDRATLAKLQIPAGSRAEVTDFILSDLKKAEDMLDARSVYKGLRINKEAAMCLAMNVALFEGSWEYYHKNDAFKAEVDNSTKYLNKVLEIGDRLMAMKTVSLYTIPGDNSGKAYASLFNSTDLSDVSEVLLWRKYSPTDGVYNIVSSLLAAGICSTSGPSGITQSLVDNYLNQDGSFTNIKAESYKDFINEFKNRDPRLLQTVMHQDCPFRDTTGGLSNPLYVAQYKELPDPRPAKTDPAYEQFHKDSLYDSRISPPRLNQVGNQQNITGYHTRLGINTTYNQGNSYTAFPILRYAEALLDYAEAAAILGKASPDVLNKTLKLVQERAGLKYVEPTKLDPNYPSFGYEVSPVIQAIRRDRRSEFALQGMRLYDILRWNAASTLIHGYKPTGAYFGENSILRLSFPASVRAELSSKDKGLKLNDEGYLEPLQVKLPDGYQFNVNRDYLLPIPINELSLDKKLKQNPGW